MKKILLNKWFHLLLLTFLLISATLYSFSETGVRQKLQNIVFDQYNRIKQREPSNQVVIVDLDENSLKELGQWPWPRSIVAQMVQNLTDFGAKVIAFDMVFAETDRTSPRHIAQSLPLNEKTELIKQSLKSLPDNDFTFSQTIKSVGNVVTGFSRARIDETRQNPQLSIPTTVLVKDRQELFRNISSPEGVATNLPIFSKLAAGNGHFMVTPESDGIIRRVNAFYKFPKDSEKPTLYPSLSLEALRVFVNPKARAILRTNKNQTLFDSKYLISLGEYKIPVDEKLRNWVYYRDMNEQDYISAVDVIKDETKEEFRSRIDGKIVFIGTS
ncbi:MAG: CHASE2 domain-containing protein, partial [Pseudomonadota bacterium]